VVQDILLVMTLDLTIANWLTRLRIDPTNIQVTIFQASIVVLDVTHRPCHLDTTF